MARFILASDTRLIDDAEKRWSSIGLKNTTKALFPGGGVIVAQKRVKKYVNFVDFGENEGWAFGVGSFVSESGKIGAEALQEVYENFSTESQGVNSKTKLYGHYAIGIKKESEIWIWGDEINSYPIVYDGVSEDHFVVSNSLYDMLFAGYRMKADEYSKVFAVFHGQHGIGKNTVVQNIKRLRGKEQLQLNLKTSVLKADVKSLLEKDFLGESHDCGSLVERFGRMSEKLFSLLKSYENISINATGGIDTRLILANAKKVGMNPHLLYGVGNSGMTNTKSEDLDAARNISQFFGWPLYVMDWGQEKIYSYDERASYTRRYGFNQLYGSTKGVIAELEGKIVPYPGLQLGGYNPAFTNIKPWELNKDSYSLRDIAVFMSKEYIDIFVSDSVKSDYLNYLVSELKELVRYLGLSSVGKYTENEFVMIFLEARKGIESNNLVSFNEFGVYIAPFYTSDLYEFLVDVPGSCRAHDSFQLQAIAQADEQSLNIPVYSGCRRFDVDIKKMRMSLPFRDRVISGIKKAAPIGLKSLLKRAYSKPQSLSLTDGYRNAVYDELQKSYPSDCIDYQSFSLKYLPSFYRFMMLSELPQSLNSKASGQ